MRKEDVRDLVLVAKEKSRLTWGQIGEEVGRNTVGAAELVYGYSAATEAEADALTKLFDLPAEAKETLMKPPDKVNQFSPPVCCCMPPPSMNE